MSRSPSPSRSAISTLIGPGQLLQHVCSRSASCPGSPSSASRPRRSRSRATARSRSPSPSRSPARTSATRAISSTSTRLVNRPRPSFSSTTTEPIFALLGNSTPRLATSDVEVAVAIEVDRLRRARARATSAPSAVSVNVPARRLPDPRRRGCASTSQATMSVRPSPSRSTDGDVGDERTVVRRRTAGPTGCGCRKCDRRARRQHRRAVRGDARRASRRGRRTSTRRRGRATTAGSDRATNDGDGGRHDDAPSDALAGRSTASRSETFTMLDRRRHGDDLDRRRQLLRVGVGRLLNLADDVHAARRRGRTRRSPGRRGCACRRSRATADR